MSSDVARITELARSYLVAPPTDRGDMQTELDAWKGDFDQIVAALRSTPQETKTGWILGRAFTSPGLAGRYPEQPMTLHVPPDYVPSKARGLAIFLHGGGRGGGDGGRHQYDHNPWTNDIFESCDRILCYPSAPPSDRSSARWQLPEAEQYIADVVREIEYHYNIDPHDMILGGHSMGGMGAYHMAHRFADRFSTVLASAGHWDFACWPALMGTTIWLSQGANDAILFRRRHGTDVEFARLARKRLQEAGVDFVYREHSGGHHSGDSIWVLREWLDWARDRRRDPFYPHVVAVTPRGLSPWSDWRRHKIPLAAHQSSTDFHDIAASPHARWVTIEGVGDETIIVDMLAMSPVRDEVERDWNEFSLTLKRKHIPGGVVEARLRGDGRTIDVAPRNVTGFTLWLHPKMVDFNDTRIMVRGQERFRGALQPSLATLLDSYLRRGDWGLLYPARVTIEDDGTWPSKDQLDVTPRP